MTKLSLAMMCVGLSVGALAGCTSSTMPAPDDPSTAVHEEPLMTSQASPPKNTVTSHRTNLAESTTASK